MNKNGNEKTTPSKIKVGFLGILIGMILRTIFRYIF